MKHLLVCFLSCLLWTGCASQGAPCNITRQQLDAKNLLLSGGRRCSQMIQSNRTLEFMCRKGYVITTPSVRKCVDGHMNLPACISEITCQPSMIEHGYITSLNKVYKENDILQFSCDTGYKHVERSDARCTQNGWYPKPACTEILCSPPEVGNGHFAPRLSLYRNEDEVHIQCEAGYRLDPRGDRSKCTENGWSPNPKCIKKPCDAPTVNNGRLTDSYRRYPDYYDYY